MPLNYQDLYNKPAPNRIESAHVLLPEFNSLNQRYGYFSPEEPSCANEFIRFFNFFNTVKDTEDTTVSKEELYLRAYTAVVILGGFEPYRACKTLQRIINEGYSKSKNPVHDALATMSIRPKSKDVMLALWRKWINEPHSKKAIQFFSQASDLASKFGRLDGYTVQITTVPIHHKNAKKGVIYLSKAASNPHKIGFIFKKEDNFLEYGGFDSQDLNSFNAIRQEIHSLPTGTLVTTQKAEIIAQLQKKYPFITREIEFDELERLAAKLTYAQFDKAPELGQLCRDYKMSEESFNHCVSLLSQQKTDDNLPNIHISGDTLNHPDYHLVKLPIDDVRALILGAITHCCQLIGGHSEECVIDGWTRKDNGFYVLLKKKHQMASSPFISRGKIDKLNYQDYEIVGQGYAWLSVFGNFVFDSWENLNPATDNTIIIDFLHAFAEAVIQSPQHAIFRVTIGRGGKTPHAFKTTEVAEIMLQGSPYHDSKTQYELASRNEFNHDVWLQSISNCLKLNDVEKNLLIKFAPMAVKYPEMLRDYSAHPLLSQWLKLAITQVKLRNDNALLYTLTVLYQLNPAEQVQQILQFMMVFTDNSSMVMQAHVTAVDKMQFTSPIHFMRLTLFFAKILTHQNHLPMSSRGACDEGSPRLTQCPIQENPRAARDDEQVVSNRPFSSLCSDLITLLELNFDEAPLKLIINTIETITPLTSFIATTSDLTEILDCLPAELRWNFYKSYKDKHPDYILSAPGFNKIMKCLAPQQRLEMHEEYRDKLPGIINSCHDFKNVAQYLTCDQCAALYAICKDKLMGLITNCFDIQYIFEYVSSVERSTIIKSYKDKLPSMLIYATDMTNLFKYLTFEERADLFEGSLNQLAKIVCNAYEFSKVLEPLTLTQRTRLYEASAHRLPTLIRTVEALESVLKHLPSEQRKLVCIANKNKFSTIFKNTTELASILKLLTLGECALMGETFKDVVSLFQSTGHIVGLLKALTPAQCSVLCKIYKDELFNIIKTMPEFFDVARQLSKEQCSAIYFLFHPQLLNYIRNVDDIRSLCLYLTPEQKTALYEDYLDKLPGIIQTNGDLEYILTVIPLEMRFYVYDACKKIRPELIQTLNFQGLLNAMPAEHSKVICEDFKDHSLAILVKNARYFELILKELPPEKAKVVFEVYLDRLPGIIKDFYDFNFILEHLTVEQRTQVFDACKEKLLGLSMTSFGFSRALEYLTVEQRTVLFEACQEKVLEAITTISDFSYALQYLTTEQRTFVFERCKNRFPTTIGSIGEFSTLIRNLLPEQRKAVFKRYQKQLPELFKNSYDFSILEYFTLETYAEIDQMYKNKFPGMLTVFSNFTDTLKYLTPEDRIQAYRDNREKLLKFKPSVYHFGQFLSFFSPEQLAVVCQDFTVFQTIQDFERDILRGLTPEQHLAVCEAYKETLLGMIKGVHDVCFILRATRIEQKSIFYEYYSDKLSLHIETSFHFNSILQYLTPSLRDVVYEANKDKLGSLITDAWSFSNILTYLTPAQRSAVYEMNKDKIPGLIEQHYDLCYIFQYLTLEQRRAVYETYIASKLIKDPFRFLLILAPTPTVFDETYQYNNQDIIKTSSNFINVLHTLSYLEMSSAHVIQASEPSLLQISGLEEFLTKSYLCQGLKEEASHQLFLSLSRNYQNIRLSTFHQKLVEEQSPIKTELINSSIITKRLAAQFKLAFAAKNSEDVCAYFNALIKIKEVIHPFCIGLSNLKGADLVQLNTMLNLNITGDLNEVDAETIKNSILSSIPPLTEYHNRNRFLSAQHEVQAQEIPCFSCNATIATTIT